MNAKILGTYWEADDQTRREIEKFIHGIENPLTRDMFYLHFIAGYSYQQTAQHLGEGITRDCVFMRVKRFLEKC